MDFCSAGGGAGVLNRFGEVPNLETALEERNPPVPRRFGAGNAGSPLPAVAASMRRPLGVKGNLSGFFRVLIVLSGADQREGRALLRGSRKPPFPSLSNLHDGLRLSRARP